MIGTTVGLAFTECTIELRTLLSFDLVPLNEVSTHTQLDASIVKYIRVEYGINGAFAKNPKIDRMPIIRYANMASDTLIVSQRAVDSILEIN